MFNANIFVASFLLYTKRSLACGIRASWALSAVLIIIGLSSSVYAANYPLIVGEHHVNKLPVAGAPAELPAATRWRAVDLTPTISTSDGLVEGDTLTLNLFSDTVYAARVDRVTTNVNGTVTVRGRIEGNPLAYALVSTTGNRSLVEIEIPEKNEHFIIQSDASCDHYLTDISAVVLDKLEDGPSPVPPVGAVSTDGMKGSVTAGGPLDPATVDVMMVYTPAAKTWANTSGGGIANVIAQAMAKGQLACDNSNTILTLRLARSAEIAYTESGNSGTDLDRLTFHAGYDPWSKDPGRYMEEVHTWRDQYCADVVTLLAKVEDTGGLGWLLNTTAGWGELAFNLCRVQQSGWTYTVVHEQGHNMGCHHHKGQNTQPGPGLFSYSAGWRWVGNDGGKYCSVMTYESGSYFPDGQTHKQVGYWSNPSITYQQVATGHAADGDNARSIREIKHVVAAYRASCNCITPSIDTHPINQTKCVGQSVIFTVAALGTTPLNYQWRKGGSNVGTNSPSLTINPVGTGDVGSYDCVVTNSCGTVTSNAATLTVNSLPVASTSASASQATISSGASSALTATGGSGITLRWMAGSCDGTSVGTGNNLVVFPTTTTTYYARWENSCGNSTCVTTTVTVNVHAYGVRISDLSYSPTPPNPVRVWGKVTSESPVKISDGRAEITVIGLTASLGEYLGVTGDWNGAVLEVNGGITR